jgi:preprotein translocase subunit SecD
VPKRDAAGNVTACYVLGPGAVDGNAVASAQAERDTTNGEWQIEFALTPQGTAAWNAMAARVGQGNQIAIVVDGAVASAPTLDTTDFPGRGAITGDYTQAQAEALAKRLSPG